MVDVVVGGMYGDEGKGKIVNYLFMQKKYEYVFRVNASTNASHCVNIDEHTEEYVTKQLPSIFNQSDVKLVVSPGALLNIYELKNELLNRPDIDKIKGNVIISNKISLVLNAYVDFNKEDDNRKDNGSTNQGTGIASLSRVAKHSVFLSDIKNAIDLSDSSLLKDKVRKTINCLGMDVSDFYIENEVYNLINTYLEIQNLIGQFSFDYTSFLKNNIKKETSILIEGCNGIMLDNIYGVTPYVTSCSTTLSGLLAYANLSPFHLNKAYIVLGAYSVCLNKRPFISEMDFNESYISTMISEKSNEIDKAENMSRRIGWFDIPTTLRALNGHDGCEIILTKLDSLNEIEDIKICVAYKNKYNEIIKTLPDDISIHDDYEPIYEHVKGWVNTEDKNMLEYVNYLSEKLNTPINILSIGKYTSDIININKFN